MLVRAVDDKASDTLVVVSDEGFWTGSSTLPHLHQHLAMQNAALDERGVVMSRERTG
jgi:1,2-phenylacetyl-CoA epoxidase catalytic subunit